MQNRNEMAKNEIMGDRFSLVLVALMSPWVRRSLSVALQEWLSWNFTLFCSSSMTYPSVSFMVALILLFEVDVGYGKQWIEHIREEVEYFTDLDAESGDATSKMCDRRLVFLPLYA